MTTYVTVFFGTVFLAMVLVPVVSQLAKRLQLVDEPGPRKVHKTPIPRVGGVAFAIATLVMVVLVFFMNNDIGRSFRDSRGEFLTLLAAAVFIFVVGLIDDLWSLSGKAKLACLGIASLAICASGATLNTIAVGDWFEINTGWLAWPMTIFWIAMVTVCMNFIDGLDGLAGGIAVIVCGAVAFMAFVTGQPAMAVLMIALVGGVTGFLFFNFYPAKIFMGDCGSMFLGFMIGAGSVVCQSKMSTAVGLAVPFLAMGVPIVDTGFAFVRRRVFERRSIFAADRGHLHHLLLDLGLKQRTVVIAIYAVTAISASIGVFMLTVDSGRSIALLAVGLLLLASLFASLNGGRFLDMVVALKHNRMIAYESKHIQRIFEATQTKMRNAASAFEWWEVLCEMAGEMHFQALELWKQTDGESGRVFDWAAEGMPRGSKFATLRLPVGKQAKAGWEIRAEIQTNGCLEMSGRETTLLARLMDEFPPLELKSKTVVTADPVASDVRSRFRQTEERSSDKLEFNGSRAVSAYT